MHGWNVFEPHADHDVLIEVETYLVIRTELYISSGGFTSDYLISKALLLLGFPLHGQPIKILQSLFQPQALIWLHVLLYLLEYVFVVLLNEEVVHIGLDDIPDQFITSYAVLREGSLFDQRVQDMIPGARIVVFSFDETQDFFLSFEESGRHVRGPEPLHEEFLIVLI